MHYKNKDYDLKLETDCNQLRQKLQTGNTAERRKILDALKVEFQQILIIPGTALDLYSQVHAENLKLRTLAVPDSPVDSPSKSSQWICLGRNCYALPEGSRALLPYILMHRLSGESLRNGWDRGICLLLRQIIDLLQPGTMVLSRDQMLQCLHSEETSRGTYFSASLSDNSDSEEEARFQQQPAEKRNQQLQQAIHSMASADYRKYQAQLSATGRVPDANLSTRQVITRTGDRRQILSDLETINNQIREGKAPDAELLASLNTKFLIAQYRGIHYLQNQWDAEARRKHREQSELDQRLHSSAVLAELNIQGYSEYLSRLATEPDLELRLKQAGDRLEQVLLSLHQAAAVRSAGYLFASPLHLIQNWYSANYDAYPNKIREEQKTATSAIAETLVTTQRPFVSTGDIPYHALRYAFGLKLYEGHQHNQLSPNWCADGRPVQPYAGKVYRDRIKTARTLYEKLGQPKQNTSSAVSEEILLPILETACPEPSRRLGLQDCLFKAKKAENSAALAAQQISGRLKI